MSIFLKIIACLPAKKKKEKEKNRNPSMSRSHYSSKTSKMSCLISFTRHPDLHMVFGRRQPCLHAPVLSINMLDTGHGQHTRHQARDRLEPSAVHVACSLCACTPLHQGKIIDNLLVSSRSKCLSSSWLACCNNAINQLGSSLLEIPPVVHPTIIFGSHLGAGGT